METLETLEHFLRAGSQFALKFFVAVLCGGAIGMERETTGKPAGLRTSIVVCLGATIFTQMSIIMAGDTGGDSTRIAAQIITGVGFLGAGVILHERRGGVKGVTTAAMIWLMASLGMMIGAGYLVSAIAVTAASVIMLLVLRRLENAIHRWQARRYCFSIRDDLHSRRRVAALAASYEDHVEGFSIAAGENGTARVTFRFIGTNNERRELLRDLYRVQGLRRLDGSPRA